MIVEERTYTLHAGRVPEWMRLYEQEGLEIQTRYLPRMIGYFSTELGTLNQIVHMWAYDDLNQRTQARAALYADPAWQAFLPKMMPLIQHMESRILIPASFSPLR